MKRISGGVLMAAGGVGLYLFALHARIPQGTDFDPLAPVRALGCRYPADVLLLLGGLWGLVLGFALVASGPSRAGGTIARAHLLNALLLASTLFAAWVGGAAGREARTVAAFGLAALAHVAAGLILLVLALFERPKGPVPLVLGTAVFLGGTAVGILAFLWGGA
jgi:hypothetical protein